MKKNGDAQKHQIQSINSPVGCQRSLTTRNTPSVVLSNGTPPLSSNDVRPYDVLLGRQKWVYDRQGNTFLRTLVHQHSSAYKATRQHVVKQEIVHKILTAVKEQGGRFLERAGGDDPPVWTEAGI